MTRDNFLKNRNASFLGYDVSAKKVTVAECMRFVVY